MSQTLSAPQVAVASRDLPKTMLHVAWLSIGVGLTLQILVSAVGALEAAPTAVVFVRDACQKMSWSTLVCLGVALGTTVSKSRPAWSGLAGLLSAPAAFVIARAVQKGVGAALRAPPLPVLGVGSFATLLILRAVQYAVLGAAVAHIARRPWGGLWAHVGIGVACGLVFGLPSLAITMSPSGQSTAKIIGLALNEALFPVGCSMVLFFAARLAPAISAAQQSGDKKAAAPAGR